MREIKFRGWDGADKRMGFFSLESLAHKAGVHAREFREIPLVVMQYTGLKDKNGVEIYEGDVVMFDTSIQPQPFGDSPDPGEPRNGWGIVGYDLGHAWYYLMDRTDDIDDLPLGQLLEEYGDGEVIGNIHENPGLLK
jgi:hypothetical protein